MLNGQGKVVYFLSSLRAQTAKALICTKSGVSAEGFPERVPEKCRKVRKPHFLRIFTYFLQKSAVFRTFCAAALFLESAETPLFVQINVFVVWALRLDRKYTRIDQLM